MIIRPRLDLSNSLDAARNLLGWELVHHTPEGDIGGIIIETEVYTQDDEASHSYRGRTKRTDAMFQEAGYIYMYFIYGMHWCMNIVTGPAGRGEAVLIRALQPTRGIELMGKHRRQTASADLTSGPAKLVQALAIPASYSGLPIKQTLLRLHPGSGTGRIEATPRIGISKSTEALWRFTLTDCKL